MIKTVFLPLPNRLRDRIPKWTERGACLDYPEAEDFFVEKHTTQPSQFARRVCGGCPVRGECLDYALGRPEATEFAIYGGLTPEQRRQLARDRSFVRCPGCGGAEILVESRGEVCLGCGVSWLV